MRRTPAIVGLVLSAGLVLTGCGGDEPDADTGSSALDSVTVSGEVGEKPTLEFDQPFDVASSTHKVLTEGDGADLEEGQTLDLDLVEVSAEYGTENSTTFGQNPFSVVLAAEQMPEIVYEALRDTSIGSRVLIGIAAADLQAAPDGTAATALLVVIDVKDARTIAARAEGTPVTPPAGLPTVELADDGKPTITVPGGEAPTELVAQPLITGEGDPVEAGQSLTVHYTGVTWADGSQFDSSWDAGAPASFGIGVGAVIPGWDEGLVGLPVGSQVLLVIPPDQAYGGQAGHELEPETLVFVVDILDASGSGS
ncbi:MAG: FKBP-type peptidyl-prolyl cis-trans isomerase [Jiangellaceae bacterium]